MGMGWNGFSVSMLVLSQVLHLGLAMTDVPNNPIYNAMSCTTLCDNHYTVQHHLLPSFLFTLLFYFRHYLLVVEERKGEEKRHKNEGESRGFAQEPALMK